MSRQSAVIALSLVVSFAVSLALWLPGPASAVIIDSEDGTGNTSAPPDDPGWSYVGRRAGATVVYLGLGWVVTANHVPIGDVILDGVTYPAVAGSKRRLDALPGTSLDPDLAVFRIEPHPEWPLLPIRATAPLPGLPAILIGNGKNRGAPLVWESETGPVGGYSWGSGKDLRWGVSVVSVRIPELQVGDAETDSIATEFREGSSRVEGSAANGDSGGGVFLFGPSGWELGGVMYALGPLPSQPASTAIYGNLTYSVDLSAYRDQLVALTRSRCSNEVDDDGDLMIDHPQDAECTSPADDSEQVDCDDGRDNDGDGSSDFPEDPGCDDALDGGERSPALVCDDDFDNDGDGAKDAPHDPGCRDAEWHSESPDCNDGVDNDGDGWADLEDLHCTYAWQVRETRPPTCGLGFELIALAPLLARLAGRRRSG